MKRLTDRLFLCCAVACFMFGGCGSSEKSADNRDQMPPPSPVKTGDQSSQGDVNKPDTLNVSVQNTQRPSYEQSGSTQTTPTGKFAVQIGAYKMADNAERVASLARERFKKNVYTIPDKSTDLYKVMVGDFSVKDEARRFRDEMVQQYPSDYKDAWVSELAEK